MAVDTWHCCGFDWSFRLSRCPNCGHMRELGPDHLLVACISALAHIAELEEAWRTGAISEHDGQGGARSSRNVEVRAMLEKAIERAMGLAEAHAAAHPDDV